MHRVGRKGADDERVHARPAFSARRGVLLRGEWERGWNEYQWRFDLPGNAPLMPPTTQPRWDGTPFDDGTLLLIADQGFGDVIQFSRYIPWARERCPNIAIGCSAEMIPLLRQVDPRRNCSPRGRTVRDYVAFPRCRVCPPGWHAHRYHFGHRSLTCTPIPPASPLESRIDGLVPKGLRRIGLSGPAGRRTTTTATVRRSDRLGGDGGNCRASRCCRSRKARRPTQAGRYFGTAPLINLGAEINDYDDTMAILANIDCLVTVDTSVAHLAGAMGSPVWIMLPFAPDWRWLLERTDTPWYPSLRLFRQSTTGVWTDVMSKAAELVAAVRLSDRSRAV